MKKARRLFVVLAAILMLAFGTATVYAMSADAEAAKASSRGGVVEECAAEEMAVGAYYEGWAPESIEVIA